MDSLTTSVNGIPIISFKSLMVTDTEVLEDITHKVHLALKSHSCFYVTDYGITEETITTFLGNSRQFFALPDHAKALYTKGCQKGIDICGYSRATKQSFRERFDFEFHPRDIESFPQSTLPEEFSGLPELYTGLTALGRFLLERVATAVNMAPDCYVNMHRSVLLGDTTIPTKAHLSSIHYEEVENKKDGGDVQLIMEKHTDLSTITFLLSTAPGLQIQLPKGVEDWVDAEPIDGAIFVNVGDILEYLTNKEYVATIHRVKHFGSDSTGRQSIAFFLHPDANVSITPSRTTLGEPMKSEMNAATYFEKMIIAKNV